MNIFDDRKKIIFSFKINKRGEEEKSNFGKLLFKENILFLNIIITLFAIELYINKQISETRLTKNRKIKIIKKMKIHFEHKELEQKTFGQLCHILYPFIKQKEKELYKDLKLFISLRNNITHNMLGKYKDIAELEKDSKKVVDINNKTLKDLENFWKKIET